MWFVVLIFQLNPLMIRIISLRVNFSTYCLRYTFYNPLGVFCIRVLIRGPDYLLYNGMGT